MIHFIKKVIREDNFLSLAGNLIIALFGFAGFALLARSYSLDLFGQFVLYISTGSFIEMFRFGITNTAIIRHLSGTDQIEREQFIGSNWQIGFAATIIICAILFTCNIFFPDPIKKAGYEYVFLLYPLQALLNLPFNNALVILQADRKYGKMLLIKALVSIGFFIVLVVNFVFLNLTIKQLIWALLFFNGLTSALSMVAGWDGFRYFFKATKQSNLTVLNFGKYTTFTLIGTNLLRSADTFIISLSPLGTAAVALYSIPMKLTELQQIPLRSFVATAFPKMSKASIEGKLADVKNIFYTYSGAMSYLFVFVSVFTFIFADFFVMLLGGDQYLGVDPLTGFNTVTIMRIFSVYGLLLPIDRMTGVCLDSINKPDLNFLKVLFMVIVNIAGDLIAIFIFKSLNLVAVGSILFTIIGIVVGFYFLSKELKLEYRRIFSSGISFYRHLYQSVKSKSFILS